MQCDNRDERAAWRSFYRHKVSQPEGAGPELQPPGVMRAGARSNFGRVLYFFTAVSILLAGSESRAQVVPLQIKALEIAQSAAIPGRTNYPDEQVVVLRWIGG